MNFSTFSEKERAMEERIRRIVELNCRRDQILGVVKLDLRAMEILAIDYENAHMPCMAADLRRRLEYYRERELVEVW